MYALDAVVVNYRTPGDLEEFLRSWAEVEGEIGGGHLTVVNVCPEEADKAVFTVALEEHLNWASLTEATWTSNVGYNVAVNCAARWQSAPYLACFNADVVLKPGVLRGCLDALEEHRDWAVVGPRQVDDAGRITCAGTFGTPEAPKMRGWLEFDRGQFSDVRDDCVHVSGSAMFWRRHIWDELTACPTFQEAAPGATGALLPVWMYFGETYACYHALSHGYRVAFDGRVAAVHKWHRSSAVGGEVERRAPEDQAAFRAACDLHEIPHD